MSTAVVTERCRTWLDVVFEKVDRRKYAEVPVMPTGLGEFDDKPLPGPMEVSMGVVL